MALKINGTWEKPISLTKSNNSRQWELKNIDLNDINQESCVYVFARKYGKNIYPIYIGRTKNFRGRIKGHLNTVSLMNAIFDAKSGNRLILQCIPKIKPGQKIENVLKTLETALIKHSLLEGHEILNKQGTKPKYTTIELSGNRDGIRIGSSMKL